MHDVDLAADALALEQLEDALRNGVVLAVASPAHAAEQLVVAQKRLPFVVGEVTGLVRTHKDGCLQPTAPDLRMQSVERQPGVDAAAHELPQPTIPFGRSY